MIGFDRPLKPRWIYETLLLAEPGQRLQELNLPFEKVARELTGKEGKRKVRTVLFRYFIRDADKQGRARSELPLKKLSHQKGCEYMKPIYLFYLVGSSPTLYKITEDLFRLYSYGKAVNTVFLQQKVTDRFGERDVVNRSVRSFLKTLSYFGVMQTMNDNLMLKKPLPVNKEQLRIILQLYAKDILKTPQVSLRQLHSPLFCFFALPDIKTVAKDYSGHYWEYQHRLREDFLVVY